MFSKTYSIRKSRSILRTAYNWYKKKGNKLAQDKQNDLKDLLTQLDQAVRAGDKETANSLAHRLESFAEIHFKKSIFDYVTEFVFALALALAVATVVRSMWFELYEIPTGSMRPTFRELDHLTVSKLAFGLNVPLKTDHFYFDPNLVKRTGVLIFSGENIPIIDQDTTYFYMFPYKKRYIKRNIGKPGDLLYFYGGKIYGIDSEGNPITELLDSPWMQGLEHIPFISFEGLVTQANRNGLFLFQQMHKPVGRAQFQPGGSSKGEVFDGKKWLPDNPEAAKTIHNHVETYSDLFGIRNFAMARLLTKKQLEADVSLNLEDLEDGVLYLELRHTPNLMNSKFIQDRRGGYIQLNTHKTVIPLKQEHLDALMDNMYTARFVVTNGRAARYNIEDGSKPNPGSPYFPDVSDGTYEFYHGKAERVGWGGVASALPEDHPLYRRDPANIQKLFNLGIDLDNAFAPQTGAQLRYPQRYAYFRDGDLYLLGAPIFKKTDPTLEAFVAREQKREDKSSSTNPYSAFKDHGPPLKEDGSLDVDFLKAFGVKVPDGHYMMLGDNHAMSADSRLFGFVPENNIQGAPSLIIWPPGERLGKPSQPPYPLFTVPRMIVWGIALLIAGLWYLIHRRNQQKPLHL